MDIEAQGIVEIIGVFIPFAVFATIFGIVYLAIKARNKEKLAMIEKGFDPSLFENKKKSTTTFAKLGVVAIGLAIGLLLGNFFENNLGLEGGKAGMIILFTGAAFVLSYFVGKKLEEKE
jgi:fucose permease